MMLLKRIIFPFALIAVHQCIAAVERSCDQDGDSGMKCMARASDVEYTIAVCTATGNQGREVVRRLKESPRKFRVIGLTRNGESKGMADSYVQTNYTTDSLKEVFSSNNVDALFVNYIIMREESDIEAGIVDAAIDAHVKHIIYSSTVVCDTNTGVGHWESSFQTESYLRKAAEQAAYDIKYHVVRLAHFNENILPGSYFPPKKGKVTYLWDVDVAFATSSLRDVARVIAKLFADPSVLPNGEHIDAVTELVTANQVAQAISLAKNETIRAVKGPWFFLRFGNHFGWIPNTLVNMAKYFDNLGSYNRTQANFEDMPNLLKDELEKEPLETIDKFALRHYGKES